MVFLSMMFICAEMSHVSVIAPNVNMVVCGILVGGVHLSVSSDLTANCSDAVAISSADGLIGTGFASRYRLQPRTFFFKGPMGRCKATTPSSNKITINY